MSKVFISADIEGVAGVVGSLQTVLGQPEFESARRWMTLEVNAAIEGAIEAGATEFVVCDSHAHMENLLPDLLHPEARLVRGAIRESLQMQGIDGSFDALFVTGTHAAAGTRNAVLDHTWVGKSVFNLRMDGVTLNEACLNAIVAGHNGVPLALVTGDAATIEQTRQTHPAVEGAVVKTSYSRYCTESLHPSKAQDVIRAAAKRAIERLPELKPVAVPGEVRMEIEFLRTDMADAADLIPGVERINARTIAYTGDPDTIFRLQELILFRLKYEF
jgi:D-amino peptidase